MKKFLNIGAVGVFATLFIIASSHNIALPGLQYDELLFRQRFLVLAGKLEFSKQDRKHPCHDYALHWGIKGFFVYTLILSVWCQRRNNPSARYSDKRWVYFGGRCGGKHIFKIALARHFDGVIDVN